MVKTTTNNRNVEGVNGIITYLVQNLVSLNANELSPVVEMHRRQLTTLEQLGCESSSNLHDGLEHLVIAVSSKEDLACVHLIQGTTDGPHVDRVVVRNT